MENQRIMKTLDALKKHINESTQIIIDEELVKVDKKHSGNVLTIPALKIATEMGKKIIANIVMLGYFTAISKIVDEKIMKETVKSSVPESMAELNMKAFETGFNWSSKQKK